MEVEGEEALVKAADDVEDEIHVGDQFTKVSKVLGELLVAVAVFSNREIALGERPELLVGVEGLGRAVPKKLGFDGEPQDLSRGVALGDGVDEVVGDCAKNPGADNRVHPYPVRRGLHDVGEDMAL